MLPVAVIRARAGSAEIEDGRMTMAACDDDPILWVQCAQDTPLGEREPVVSLAITGKDFEADVELTAAAADRLVDALDDDR